MKENYRYVGKAIPRNDGADIVTGATRFLEDLPFKKLLHGKVLRSAHAHALIKGIDKSRAESLPGVKAVLTWQDVPDWYSGNPRATRILDRKVRYRGDAVALIAADSANVAEEATRLIDVEYDVLPFVLDVEEALQPGAPQLYEEAPGNICPNETPFFGPNSLAGVVMGDVAKGFAEADVIAQGDFCYENIPNPIPAESPGAVALWEEPSRLTVWVTSQTVSLNKDQLSRIMPGVEIRTIGGPSGGSFGSKLMSWQVQCYAALLSKATRLPVRLIFSKKEHLACFVLRPATRLAGRIGMKKDGTVTAVEGRWTIGTGYYSGTTQIQMAVGSGEAQIAVRCPNWDVRPTIVCTNRNASGIVRGFGGQELKCALMPLLSLAMEKAGLDPFEVLKKNFIKPGDRYVWRDGNRYICRGIDFGNAMDRGAEVFGWRGKWKGWLTPTTVDGPRRHGIGVGIHGNADVGEDVSEAYVKLGPDGRVLIYSSVNEHGTGQRSNCLKVVAEVLQVPIETVSMTLADSLTSPPEWGALGSRGTYAILSAMINAAEDARKKLFEIAAPLLGAEVDRLDTMDGAIWIKDRPDRRILWSEAMRLRTVMGHGHFDADYSFSNCMMSFVEVKVDTETGKVDLIRVVNATDVGQIIDPQGLEGQLNGCLGSAGIDSALFEETILDPATGAMLNSNLIDYKWRTTAELPEMEHVVLETPFSTHRFKAIGVGEIATSPGPSAVLMAVSNAIGRWLHRYPLTPERVLEAINDPAASSRASIGADS